MRKVLYKIKVFLSPFNFFFLKTTNAFSDWIKIKNGPIIVSSYMQLRWGGPIRKNWGDDINYQIINWLSGKNCIDYNASFFSKGKINYLCIGSILHLLTNDKSIVWGSGMMGKNAEIKNVPKCIKAVRGPLTRDVLVRKGIDCPSVYGDPAMLIKLMYKPTTTKKYRYGFIPHIYDNDYSILIDYIAGHKDCTLISMKSYHDWTDIPRQICECEYIISSSLHGVIIADTYGIPNVWVEFRKEVGGHGFKFRDYYKSVNKDISVPICCKEKIDLKSLVSLKLC